MGGNAIPNARRVNKQEYIAIKHDLCEYLTETFGVLCRFDVIPSYSEKTSFGDMDILVADNHVYDGWIDELKGHLHSSDVVRNGPVTSFEYNGFQIDIIMSPIGEYEFALGYFSYNDLGNFIGRVAHRNNLKFGHNGLWLPVRDGNYKHPDILVSRDFREAIEFLGFSYERWKCGFGTRFGIYDYVAHSEYFKKDLYPLEHRSHTSRVRDAKRESYRGLLEFIDTTQPEDGKDADLFQKALLEFEHVRIEYDNALADIARRKEVKKKFNGNIVREVTGLEGKELGAFMTYLKNTCPFNSDEVLLGLDEADINNNIKFTFSTYKLRALFQS